jgi:hypothetical protein
MEIEDGRFDLELAGGEKRVRCYDKIVVCIVQNTGFKDCEFGLF